MCASRYAPLLLLVYLCTLRASEPRR